jgi:hypothetical protein
MANMSQSPSDGDARSRAPVGVDARNGSHRPDAPTIRPPAQSDGATSALPDRVGVSTSAEGTWVSGERVDADVIRVKRLKALLVEANEIRCPDVVRSKGAPVAKDLAPWRIEGDIVEVDRLNAHTVSARLIIADSIYAVIVRRLAKTHHWAGEGKAPQVRNRVTVIKDREPSLEVPSF